MSNTTKDWFYHMVFVTATDFCHTLESLEKEGNDEEVSTVKEEQLSWKNSVGEMSVRLHYNVAKTYQTIQEAEDQFK